MQEHYRGQFDSSDRTEKRAKKWVICSIVSGVVFVVIMILLVAAAQGVRYGLAYRTEHGDDGHYHHGRY